MHLPIEHNAAGWVQRGGKGGKSEDILGGRKQQLKPFRLHQHRLRRKGGGRFYLQAGVEKGV